MGDSNDSHHVEPCDICGDIGFPEKIVTCHQCGGAREHVYCSRVILFIIPEIWVCEECRSREGGDFPQYGTADQLGKALVSYVSEKAQDHTFQSKDSGRLKGECGNVRFIPCKEVNAFDCKLERIDTLSDTERVETFNTPLEKPMKHVFKGKPTDNFIPVKRIETSTSEMSSISALSTSKDASRFISGFNLNNGISGKVEENKSQDTLCRMEKCTPNFPASEATWCWRGTVVIAHSASRREYYDGFQAQFPLVVHRKAFEFTKQLPRALLFTMIPSKISLEVFQNEYPGTDCIALYFFPGRFKRSKQHYKHLLGIMETKDLVLRSQLASVELFIFPSKWLREDLLELKPFLWGVYRSIKTNVAVSSVFSSNTISQEQSLEVQTSSKQFNLSDGPPGFPRKAIDASGARRPRKQL